MTAQKILDSFNTISELGATASKVLEAENAKLSKENDILKAKVTELEKLIKEQDKA